MRKSQPLGGDHASEVRLVADDEVGPPLQAQVVDGDRALPRNPAGEAVSKLTQLALDADDAQRPPLRRPIGAGRVEDGADLRAYGRPPTGQGHGMAGRLGCTSNGHERLGVPGAAGEGEEEVGARKRRRPASRAASRGA